MTSEHEALLHALLGVTRESIERLESNRLELGDLDAQRETLLEALRALPALDPADPDAERHRRTLVELQGAHEQLVKRLTEALETTLGRLRETDRGRRALGGYGQASVGSGRTGARLGRW